MRKHFSKRRRSRQNRDWPKSAGYAGNKKKPKKTDEERKRKKPRRDAEIEEEEEKDDEDADPNYDPDKDPEKEFIDDESIIPEDEDVMEMDKHSHAINFKESNEYVRWIRDQPSGA